MSIKDMNKVELQGLLHSFDLKENDSAIYGTVKVQVDENGTIVPTSVYAAPTYQNGKSNKVYEFLSNMVSGNFMTVKDDDEENATWVNIFGAVSVDYYAKTAKNVDDLSSTQKIRIISAFSTNHHEFVNQWRMDILLTAVNMIDENPEKGTPEYATMTGYVIDTFRKIVYPVKVDAIADAPKNYVMSLPVSKENPVYTRVRGAFKNMVSTKIIKSAFGEDEKIETRSMKWELNWMPSENYVFGEDITMEEYNEYLAALDEYKEKQFKRIKEKNEEDNEDLPF